MVQALKQERLVETLFEALATPEGDGVTVYRSIGRRGMINLDPFLLLDEMNIGADVENAGFPDHPHRGFETVSYMLSGQMTHKDSSGNSGTIGPGDVQWMTAGHGIIHGETPISAGVPIRGFQLWVNLPSAQKMRAPRYQDVPKESIPTVAGEGYSAKLIAGTLNGIVGPVTEIAVQPLFADVTLSEDGEITLPIPSGHTAFIYGIDSALKVGGTFVAHHMLAILADGHHVRIAGKNGARFILVAGAPIGEPIARHGPFVMNTDQEIMQTLTDWNNGRLLKN